MNIFPIKNIQSHKSRILSAAEFIEYADNVVVEAPHNPLEKDNIEVIDRYSKGERYQSIDFAVLSADDLNILSQENLTTILNGYLDQPEPNFVRIRWFFRRLAQVGVPGAVSLVLQKP